jgi:hypothetical protein
MAGDSNDALADGTLHGPRWSARDTSRRKAGADDISGFPTDRSSS